ncbi:MAG: CHAD domain-containing protein [Acidimicrobiales bacterium]
MAPTFSHPDRPSSVVVDTLVRKGFEVSASQRTTITVLDTFDGRLHQAGLRLTLRRSGPIELVLVTMGAAQEARLSWSKVPSWPSDLPAGPFRSRLASVTKERALLPLLTISADVRTLRHLDHRGKVVVAAELLDHVGIEDADEAQAAELPTWLVEVLPVLGHADAAEAAVTRLGAAGLRAQPDDLVALAARSVGVPLHGRDSSPTVPLEASDGALDAFRRVLANLADTIDMNLEGTIADTDPEFLHELRVAVRRTRSVLAHGKSVLTTDIRDRYRDAFGELGQVTGPPRDLDVQVMGWAAYVSPLDSADAASLETVRVELDARRSAAHQQLSNVLRRATTRDLLDEWRAWLSDPDVGTGEHEPIGAVVARRIAKAQDKVIRDGRAIAPTSPAEMLHDLRKDAKKLRYLFECFGSLFPAKIRKAFVTQLKALQDNLGDHQDAEVQLAELRDLAREMHQRGSVDADVLLAMGRLSDHLDRRRQHERDDFAQRFVAYDTKANGRVLRQLLHEVADA